MYNFNRRKGGCYLFFLLHHPSIHSLFYNSSQSNYIWSKISKYKFIVDLYSCRRVPGVYLDEIFFYSLLSLSCLFFRKFLTEGVTRRVYMPINVVNAKMNKKWKMLKRLIRIWFIYQFNDIFLLLKKKYEKMCKSFKF